MPGGARRPSTWPSCLSHDSTRVHTYREGGSDQAGFVQVIQGYSPDMERLSALGRAREQTMAEQAPHILGMTVAEHADRRGDFTQTVYFTSQQEARWFGREQPVEFDPSFAEFSSLMTEVRYFDLRRRGWTAGLAPQREGRRRLPRMLLPDVTALTLGRDRRDLRHVWLVA